MVAELANGQAPFHERLADAMERGFVGKHPDPNTKMEFVGSDADGRVGRLSISMQEYVDEIRSQTEFGKRRTAHYLGISESQGDPTGEAVILDFETWWER